MDLQIAKQRLSDEHAALHELLLASALGHVDERSNSDQPGDRSDFQEGLTNQEEDDAVVESLRRRLSQVHGALDRLEAGTYGRSLRSGDVIPDERLEADPAAELTAQEAAL